MKYYWFNLSKHNSGKQTHKLDYAWLGEALLYVAYATLNIKFIYIYFRGGPGFFSGGGPTFAGGGGVQTYRNTIPFHIQTDVSLYLF